MARGCAGGVRNEREIDWMVSKCVAADTQTTRVRKLERRLMSKGKVNNVCDMEGRALRGGAHLWRRPTRLGRSVYLRSESLGHGEMRGFVMRGKEVDRKATMVEEDEFAARHAKRGWKGRWQAKRGTRTRRSAAQLAMLISEAIAHAFLTITLARVEYGCKPRGRRESVVSTGLRTCASHGPWPCWACRHG